MARRPGLLAPPRAAEAAALAVILTVVGLAAGRHLGAPSAEYDEGVYLGSADALGRGAALGTDVFASQPPLFFLGLRAAGAASGGDPALMRAAVLALALGGALAAAVIVRPLAGAAAGCLAALLVGLAPTFVDRAAVVSADVPAIALGLMALAAAGLAVPSDRRPRPAWALAAGGLAAAAVLVKLLALPFLVALAVGAWRRGAGRREWLLGLAGASAVAGAVLVPFADRLGALWEGAVGIRGAARGVALGSSGADPRIVLGFAGLALAAAAGLSAARPRSWRAWLDARASLLALLAAAAVVLAVQRPLFVHHWALLAVPLALLAAAAAPLRARPVQVAALGGAALLLLPGAWRGRVLLAPGDRDDLARAAASVRAGTAPGERVVSDLPLVPLAAGRPAVPSTVDASLVRVGSGALSRTAVLRAADGAGAVVVGRAFAAVPGLEDALAARFPRSVSVGRARVMLRGSPSASIR